MFTEMEEYANGEYPYYCSTGGGDYELLEDYASYYPYDVSEALGIVNDYLGEGGTVLTTNSDYSDLISEKAEDLKDAWGKKFISIADSDLGIVDTEVISNDLSNIEKVVNNQNTKITEYITNLIEKVEEIKTYIDKLGDNYDKYQKVKSDYDSYKSKLADNESALSTEKNKENPNANTISYLEQTIYNERLKIQELEGELNLYEFHKIPEPNGSWVLK